MRRDSGLCTSQFQDRGAMLEDKPSKGHRDATITPISHPNTVGPSARIQGRSSNLCCFKCREAGHKAGDCRKPISHYDKGKQLMIREEHLDNADANNDDPDYD
ncbi:hypothetical protein AMTR_s00032p00052640 [Amborella trichopoda]|uniref:CCHC-type domain-containing protein n=1 Tax=Amborella trichopoda TaxID=13333 RepID=U5CXT7_AMBTC|nr:hypothetical protein AMTR_s00032p00052640 [Amborella trichopoda]